MFSVKLLLFKINLIGSITNVLAPESRCPATAAGTNDRANQYSC